MLIDLGALLVGALVTFLHVKYQQASLADPGAALGRLAETAANLVRQNEWPVALVLSLSVGFALGESARRQGARWREFILSLLGMALFAGVLLDYSARLLLESSRNPHEVRVWLIDGLLLGYLAGGIIFRFVRRAAPSPTTFVSRPLSVGQTLLLVLIGFNLYVSTFHMSRSLVPSWHDYAWGDVDLHFKVVDSIQVHTWLNWLAEEALRPLWGRSILTGYLAAAFFVSIALALVARGTSLLWGRLVAIAAWAMVLGHPLIFKGVLDANNVSSSYLPAALLWYSICRYVFVPPRAEAGCRQYVPLGVIAFFLVLSITAMYSAAYFSIAAFLAAFGLLAIASLWPPLLSAVGISFDRRASSTLIIGVVSALMFHLASYGFHLDQFIEGVRTLQPQAAESDPPPPPYSLKGNFNPHFPFWIGMARLSGESKDRVWRRSWSETVKAAWLHWNLCLDFFSGGSAGVYRGFLWLSPMASFGWWLLIIEKRRREAMAIAFSVLVASAAYLIITSPTELRRIAPGVLIFSVPAAFGLYSIVWAFGECCRLRSRAVEWLCAGLAVVLATFHFATTAHEFAQEEVALGDEIPCLSFPILHLVRELAHSPIRRLAIILAPEERGCEFDLLRSEDLQAQLPIRRIAPADIPQSGIKSLILADDEGLMINCALLTVHHVAGAEELCEAPPPEARRIVDLHVKGSDVTEHGVAYDGRGGANWQVYQFSTPPTSGHNSALSLPGLRNPLQ